MSTPQVKSKINISTEHHTQAAECCNKAAAEHSLAAKCCTVGDHEKAKKHTKNAYDHCTKAQDHGKKSMAA